MEAGEVVAKLAELPGGQAVAAAFSEDESVWLVGGAVRDLMLGRTPFEIDLVIEGPLDSALVKLGGEAERYEQFGTATVNLHGARIDLASARRESYPQPGALPEVEPAALADDIMRRDFTINAVAVRIADGAVLSHPLALEDLAAGVLRVLHNQSFVDDPTRLWRCARYVTRLGFTVDEQTAQLAADAGPGSVSGERFGHELRLALSEPNPTAVFAAVERLNPSALPVGFTTSPARLEEALELLGDDGRRDLLTLAACSEGIELDLLVRWLDYLQFSSSERDVVSLSSRYVTGSPLRSAQSRAEVAAAARSAPLEAVALAGGVNAALWINELRFISLDISGDDMLAAGAQPGQALGAGLQHALNLTLNGEISGRDQQLAAAIQRAAELAP